MNQKFWAACVLLATACANTGCVSCCSKSYAAALQRGPDCELPTPCRGNVYLYMIHGATPSCDAGLEALRARLAEGGFAKVGVGELASAPCVYFDIKEIARCDPDARFVLLGYDLGAPAAACLAKELAKKKVPVEAVVLLDPVGCGTDPAGVQTLLVTSGTVASKAAYTERVVVPDASHFKLPAHPATVAAVTSLLGEIAARNCQGPVDDIEEWSYPHAPEMRPIPGASGGEWDLLVDRGSPAPLGTFEVSRPLAPGANPTPDATAPARPVPFAGAVVMPK